jgi:hypothetical protein
MRVFIAVLMAIPSAILLGVLLGLVVGGGTAGGTLTLWVSLVGIPVLAFFFARHTGRARNAFRRGLITLALESFCLPLVGLVFTVIVGGKSIAQQSSNAAVAGAAIGTGLAGAALLAVGVALAIAIGVPCLILYFVVKPAPAMPA